MFLMMADVLEFCRVSEALPGSGFWKFLCDQQSHVPWSGCSLHDLIAPSFYFLTGLSISLSINGRRARGQKFGELAKHAVVRAGLLVCLGILLQYARWRSVWSFYDTLTQIGLSYVPAFLIACTSRKASWLALGGILIGYWVVFALYPLPPHDFNYDAVGVSQDWLREFGLQGFAAHWQKNSNLAWAFDTWFLNLLPRTVPFTFSPLGLATLNFIPTVATMLLGVLAAGIIATERRPWQKVRWFIMAGFMGIAGGSLLSVLGICPVVKPIWTPSWVLFSGGWSLLLLAGWYLLIEIAQQRRVAYPLFVIGANSIVAYFMPHLYMGLAYGRVLKITGTSIFRIFGSAYASLTYGGCVLCAYWLALFALYHRKIFVRI
jgi:predicted acyltransferase